MFPQRRLRRLRRTPALRRLVAETHLTPDDLIAPLFVREGIDEPHPIASLPGVSQHTIASMLAETDELVALGLRSVVLFGVPEHKDAEGSGASDPDGIVQIAIRELKDRHGDDLVVIADLCLDEYTDHGHCGLLTPSGEVDNDTTIDRYAEVAIAQAEAGVDIVAPSGMMDGQVAAIRDALDDEDHDQIAILAYAAKYASALYGPFRDAVDVEISGGGDRKGYQQDPANAREALEEVRLDVAEGADIIMVKPALAYLDIIAKVRAEHDLPVAAYHVSGEYAMIKAAAANGWIDGHLVAMEHLTAIKRAGADLILTYLAREAAEALGVTTNEQLFARAQAVIPGGVNSPVRAFKAVGGTPYFVARGHGARVWDVEGTEYLDLVQSYGAVIAGHAHPKIVEAIRAAAGDGTSYGAPTEREVLLAEEISRRVPSCQKVRMVSSGTEATMTALRLARGATGRSRVVKFAGNYHGHGDALLAESGSAVAHLDPAHSPGGIPGSAGVPPTAVSDTVVAPYNDVPELDETIACVIVEPVAANMGLVAPVDGFLAGLHAECDRVGAVLIFDEVITGFRLAHGGAQAVFGITPDLTCFGKVIGGGLNVGAFGGRADLMDQLAPLGPVYQAGTLSGNPLATAAGLAALDLCDEDAYRWLIGQAECLAAGLQSALDDAGLVGRLSTAGPLIGVHLGSTAAPRDYAEAKTTDEATYAALFHALLRRGVALAPGAYEVMFPGLAHDDAVCDAIVAAARDAAVEVAAASDAPGTARP